MSKVERITLYGTAESPYAHRVSLVLEEAQVPYDLIPINLVQKPDWFAKKVNTNTGEVPYLVYGGPQLHPDESPAPGTIRLYESRIIVEFLADLLPTALLLPQDPALRAKARLFMHVVDTVLLPAFYTFLFKGASADPLYAALDKLQEALPDPDVGEYVLGERWSLADAALVPFIVRLDTLLALDMPTVAPGLGAETQTVLASTRFARLLRWKRVNVARVSMVKTYDEAAVNQKAREHMAKMQGVGKV